jgi:hypothetical protein
MNIKQSIMIAMAGTSLLAASPAQAQNTFNNEDLLLNFRNVTTPSDPNVTIDLGNVSTFLSAVAGGGGRAVLDSGGGYTATVSGGFAYSGLTDLFGAPSADNVIGFSAAAADSTGGTGLLYLTRTQATGAYGAPADLSEQQSLTAQATTAQAIGFIGAETASVDATTLGGSGANAVSYPSGDAYSYQSQAEDKANNNIVDYHGSQSTATGAGGVLESQQAGAGNVYEALWEVPVDGDGDDAGPDVYEGFFTFYPDGEVDFTVANAVFTTPPNLTISYAGGSVTVSWPNTGNYTLQQNTGLAKAGWTQSSYPISLISGMNTVTLTPPTGAALFFRLSNP